MKRITSQALDQINRVLDLTGVGSPVTELTDGIVDQALDVNPIIRRGLTPAAQTGLYNAIIRNIHGAGNTITTAVTPYDIATGARGSFTAPIPRNLELWLLAAAIRQVSGTGTLAALLHTAWPGTNLGFGVDSAGAAVTGGADFAIASWDSVLAAPGMTVGLLESGAPLARIGIRFPRGGGTLSFSSTSSAVATFDCHLVWGLFPISLGQDVLV